MRPGNLPFSPSINSAFGWETVRCLPSTFCATGRPSFKFLLLRGTFRQLPSTFRVGRKHFVHFLQLSLLLGEVLSTFRAARRPSVNFCNHFVQRGDLSTLVNFLCSLETFRPLLSAFHAAGGFRQISMQQGDLSAKSVDLQYPRETFHQIPSTFRAAGNLP